MTIESGPLGKLSTIPYLKSPLLITQQSSPILIMKGNHARPTTTDSNGKIVYRDPVSADEYLVLQRESKARSTLISALPDEHMSDFNHMIDAKDIWDAIKAKAISESWRQVSLSLRARGGLDLLTFEDLYSKLKFLESDVRGYARPSHAAFVGSSSTSQDKPAVHGSNSSSSYPSYFPSPQTSSNEHSIKVSKVVDDVVYSLLADHEKDQQLFRRFEKKVGRKIKFNGRESARFDKQLVKCYKCHQKGHFSRECRAPTSQTEYSTYKAREERNSQPDKKALVSVDGCGVVNWDSIPEDNEVETRSLDVYGMMASMYDESDSEDDVSAEECVPAEVVISADDVVDSAEAVDSADYSVSAGGAQISDQPLAFVGEVHSCSLCHDSKYHSIFKQYSDLRNQFDATVISLNSHKEAVKTFERQIKHYQNNQLAYEEKIRVLSYDLADKSNILEYKEKLINQASQEKQELLAKLDKELANQEKWSKHGQNLGFVTRFSVLTTDLEDIGANPIYNRFDKVDHIKAVPPPMTGNYKPTSNASDDNEIVREYGKQTSETTKIKTPTGSLANSNDSAFFDFSDMSSEPSPKDFSSFDSSNGELFLNPYHTKHLIKDCDYYEKRLDKGRGSRNNDSKRKTPTDVSFLVIGPTTILLKPLLSLEFPNFADTGKPICSDSYISADVSGFC
ncbi:ribonuclease H-like domain-containing protein [Tanacetum coccineum]